MRARRLRRVVTPSGRGAIPSNARERRMVGRGLLAVGAGPRTVHSALPPEIVGRYRGAVVIAQPAPVFDRPLDRAAEFRGAPGAVRFLDLPPRRFVMIDGDGTPGPDAFTPRMPGLYTTAYKLKFALKGRGVVTKVGPLEGLWWTTDEATDLDAIFAGDHGTWRWTLLMAVPDEADQDEIDRALAAGARQARPESRTGAPRRALRRGPGRPDPPRRPVRRRASVHRAPPRRRRRGWTQAPRPTSRAVPRAIRARVHPSGCERSSASR